MSVTAAVEMVGRGMRRIVTRPSVAAPVPAPVGATHVMRPRVLVVRCCRPAQFVAAVRLARSRHPGADVVGLSVAGHRRTMLEAGVDDVIEVPGATFNVFRLGPWTLARLRSRRFAEVVIPQMTANTRHHLNVYAVVATACAPVWLMPGEEPPQAFTAAEFRGVLRQAWFELCARRWDSVLFVGLVVAACARRRQPVAVAGARQRRVLHVVGSLGMGGAQVQLAAVLNRIPRDQYEVDLIVLDTSDGRCAEQWIERPDVSVTYLKHWPNLTLSLQEIVRQCRTRRYDVIHTWLLSANVLGMAAARLSEVPRVMTSVRGSSSCHQYWSRNWWWRPLDMLVSRTADIVTVNATALVRDHSRWAWIPPARIEVVHNGLDPGRMQADRRAGRERLLAATGAPTGAVLAGTVGRLAFEKNQATFLRMLALVRTSHPDVHGVLIGDGGERPRLEALAQTLGLADSVTFLGDRLDARELMAGLDLFVLPSLAEGFANVLLEATFLKVPCVASDVGGNSEVLGASSSLFPAGDAAACAARVLEVLADPTRAAGRAETAYRRALEQFTIERSVGVWLGLYRRCLSA